MSSLPVASLRIPNPFVEGRTCVYVVDAEPLTLIDTGIATERAYQAVVDGLAEHGYEVSAIKRVILTHKHIDHIGNAWRIQRESGAEILIHESEVASVTDVDPVGTRHAELVAQRLREWHVPEADFPPVQAGSRPTWEIESANARGVADGDQIEFDRGALEVIHTPGHTMGSICLRDGASIFSGDHVLPNISPNVGGGDMRQSHLLRHYLQSLARTRELAVDGITVFPGHGDPFDTLADRCDELVAHHSQRLEKTYRIVADEPEQSIYDVAKRLFGEMEQFHVVLGCAEAASHLEYLQHAGRVDIDDRGYVAAVDAP